ncbi:MAG: hypothetical protein ACYDBP_14750 [Leptospirales bacterium]
MKGTSYAGMMGPGIGAGLSGMGNSWMQGHELAAQIKMAQLAAQNNFNNQKTLQKNQQDFLQKQNQAKLGSTVVQKELDRQNKLKAANIVANKKGGILGGLPNTPIDQNQIGIMQTLEKNGFNPHLTSFSAKVMIPIYTGAIQDIQKQKGVSQDKAVQIFLQNQRNTAALMTGAKGLGAIVPKIQASMMGVDNTINLLQNSMGKIRKSLTNTPYMNTPIIALQDKLAGDPNIREFVARRETMKQELTKALIANGISGTAASDSARKEVDTIFPLNMTPSQFDRAVKISKQDMAARLAGYSQEMSNLTGQGMPGVPASSAMSSAQGGTASSPSNPAPKSQVQRLKYNPVTGTLE